MLARLTRAMTAAALLAGSKRTAPEGEAGDEIVEVVEAAPAPATALPLAPMADGDGGVDIICVLLEQPAIMLFAPPPSGKRAVSLPLRVAECEFLDPRIRAYALTDEKAAHSAYNWAVFVLSLAFSGALRKGDQLLFTNAADAKNVVTAAERKKGKGITYTAALLKAVDKALTEPLSKPTVRLLCFGHNKGQAAQRTLLERELTRRELRYEVLADNAVKVLGLAFVLVFALGSHPNTWCFPTRLQTAVNALFNAGDTIGRRFLRELLIVEKMHMTGNYYDFTGKSAIEIRVAALRKVWDGSSKELEVAIKEMREKAAAFAVERGACDAAPPTFPRARAHDARPPHDLSDAGLSGGAAVSPLRPDDVPKPVLLDGCICPLCRVTLTEKELGSLSVTIAKGSTTLKWRCYHAAGVCTKGQKSISVPNFAIMLSQLSVFERHCVLISVANYAAAKKVISLRLAAEAAEIAADGPLDG
jgi:hypothetical protein